MEEWIEIWEFDWKDRETNEWLFKLLDEEKIPYMKEVKEYFGNKIFPYKKKILVYVPKEDKVTVESYLKEYNNTSNIVYEEAEELLNATSNEEAEEEMQSWYKKFNLTVKWLFILWIGIWICCGIIMRSSI